MGVAHHPEERIKGARRADCRIRPVARWWSHPNSPTALRGRTSLIPLSERRGLSPFDT